MSVHSICVLDLDEAQLPIETRQEVEKLVETGYRRNELLVHSDGSVGVDYELVRCESFTGLFDPDEFEQQRTLAV